MAYAKQIVGGVIASDTVVDAIRVDTGTTIPATLAPIKSGVAGLDNSGGGATYYVDGVTGDDADSGLTWALAKATIAGGLAVMADYSTLYVGGVAYTESVSTPVGIERGKIIGVCNSNQIPFWQAATTAETHLAIVSGEWEVANFRFYGTTNTAPYLTITAAGSSSIIRDCWFSGSAADNGIEAIGPNGCATDIKILRNRFSGFTSTGILDGAVCGSNYDDSGAVVWEVMVHQHLSPKNKAVLISIKSPPTRGLFILYESPSALVRSVPILPKIPFPAHIEYKQLNRLP